MLLGLCSHHLFHLPQFLPTLSSLPQLCQLTFGPPFRYSSVQGPLLDHGEPVASVDRGALIPLPLCSTRPLTCRPGSANTWWDCLPLRLHLLPPRSGSAPCPGLHLFQPLVAASVLVLGLVPTLILAQTCFKLCSNCSSWPAASFDSISQSIKSLTQPSVSPLS